MLFMRKKMESTSEPASDDDRETERVAGDGYL